MSNNLKEIPKILKECAEGDGIKIGELFTFAASTGTGRSILMDCTVVENLNKPVKE